MPDSGMPEARIRMALAEVVSEAAEDLAAVYLAGSWRRCDALSDSGLDFILVLRDDAPEKVSSRPFPDPFGPSPTQFADEFGGAHLFRFI